MCTFTTATLLYVTLISYITAKTCCVTRHNRDDCLAESGTGSPCTWLDPNLPSMKAILDAMSEPIHCVNSDYATCKAADPTDPCVSDNPPPALLGPNTTPDDCTITSQPTISPIPTPPPTFEPCAIDTTYNIQFILDESGSVNDDDPTAYSNTVDLVHRLIDNSVTKYSQISLLAFSKETDMLHPFSWNQDRTEIFSALAAEKTNYAGITTDTYNALKDGIKDFKESPNCNKDDVNILILITDGTPYCGNWFKGTYDYDCKTNVCGQSDILNGLSEYNIRVVLVGITSGFSSDALNCLVANPNDIFEFADFTHETLRTVEQEMREKILCPMMPIKTNRHVKEEQLMVHTLINGWNMNVDYYSVMGIIMMVLIGSAIYWCKSSNKKHLLINDKCVNGYSTFNSV
eukprot:381843_1